MDTKEKSTELISKGIGGMTQEQRSPLDAFERRAAKPTNIMDKITNTLIDMHKKAPDFTRVLETEGYHLE